MTDPLAATITAQQPLDNGVRVGRVESVLPMVVTVAGAVVDAGKLRSYEPVVGDNVAVLRQDNAWLVLGAVDRADVGFSGVISATNVATITGFQANSTVIGTEVAFASASWNVAEFFTVFAAGQLYVLHVQLSPLSNGAGASTGNIKVRKGQATITGQILMQDYIQIPAGFAGAGRSQWSRGLVANLTGGDIVTKLSLTAVLASGAGSLGIYGGDGAAPTMIQMEHKGPIAQHDLIPGSYASIT